MGASISGISYTDITEHGLERNGAMWMYIYIYFLGNEGVRVSLRASRLIPRVP